MSGDRDAVFEQAKRILARLAANGALQGFWGNVVELRLIDGRGRRLLTYPNPGDWTMDASHPAAARILAAPLPVEHRAVYLASLLHSAANAMMRRLTDADDVQVQEALAHWAAPRDANRAARRPSSPT